MVSSLGFCLELKTLAVLPKPTMWTSGGSDPLSPPMLGIQGISSSSPSSPPVQSPNESPQHSDVRSAIFLLSLQPMLAVASAVSGVCSVIQALMEGTYTFWKSHSTGGSGFRCSEMLHRVKRHLT